MIEYIAQYIGTRFNVDVLHVDNPYVDLGSIEVSAEYDGLADEEHDTCIKIVLVTNILDESYIWSTEQVDRFVVESVDSICHELAHMRQARLRNYIDVSWDYVQWNDSKQETQYYLSHPDEIDAYSYNIVSEVLSSKNNIMSNVSTCTMEDSINLWTYLNIFDYNYSNPVIKKLLKKVYLLIEKTKKSVDFDHKTI